MIMIMIPILIRSLPLMQLPLRRTPFYIACFIFIGDTRSYILVMRSPFPCLKKHFSRNRLTGVKQYSGLILQEWYAFPFFKSSNMMGSLRGFVWNCGGLRRGVSSTLSKVMYFTKFSVLNASEMWSSFSAIKPFFFDLMFFLFQNHPT